jgi:hypothetical protein
MGLAEELCAAWQAGISLDDLLARFVIETQSRASGCWRLKNGSVRLVGFGVASDMPTEVSQGFQDATRSVSLKQQGLGIVKAAVSRQPAIGRRDARATGLDGSASWIARFGANTSLAVPICDRRTQTVIGVLAVSTVAFVEEGDALWQTMTEFADKLGQSVQ